MIPLTSLIRKLKSKLAAGPPPVYYSGVILIRKLKSKSAACLGPVYYSGATIILGLLLFGGGAVRHDVDTKNSIKYITLDLTKGPPGWI